MLALVARSTVAPENSPCFHAGSTDLPCAKGILGAIMAGGRFGHAVLAGAVGGSAIAGGAATGPLLATAFDLAAAVATAGIAAHAVEVSARERGVSSAGGVPRAARGAAKRSDAPLAAHAVDVICRARAGDVRALRSAAMLLGRVTSAHARGLAFQLLGSWWAPLRDLTQLTAPLGAARAALENAGFVREMIDALPEASRPGFEITSCETELLGSGPFAAVAGTNERAIAYDEEASSPAPQRHLQVNARAQVQAQVQPRDWEVAA